MVISRTGRPFWERALQVAVGIDQNEATPGIALGRMQHSWPLSTVDVEPEVVHGMLK
jgi:hypothetical protein